jgi:hypothetical protein
MTTAPTAADIDAWAGENSALGGYFGGIGSGCSTTTALISNSAQFAASSEGPVPATAWVVAYTQNDSTAVYQPILDPTSDQVSALICWALVNEYGNVLVREYTYTMDIYPPVDSTTTLDCIADSTEQTRINTQANWVQFS